MGSAAKQLICKLFLFCVDLIHILNYSHFIINTRKGKMMKSILQNTYTKQGWVVPVNNWNAWSGFFKHGLYSPANDNN